MSSPVLGYWNLRGIAEPIRYLLHHVGKEYQDKMYRFGTTPETFREEWYKERNTLDLDFPNLPYYKDGDVKITHCLAILRHLARKYNLAGENEAEKLRVDLAEQQANDFRWSLVSLVLNPDYKKLREAYVNNLGPKLDEFHAFLGDRNFVAGDKVSYADFLLYEVLDQHLYLDPQCLVSRPALQAYVQRVEELPNIKKYRSSKAFKPWPMFSHTAHFGGSGPPTR